jgi:hypothetical protein
MGRDNEPGLLIWHVLNSIFGSFGCLNAAEAAGNHIFHIFDGAGGKTTDIDDRGCGAGQLTMSDCFARIMTSSKSYKRPPFRPPYRAHRKGMR